MTKPNQRAGAESNAHVGREFEESVRDFLRRSEGLELTPNCRINVGVAGREPKLHAFDLGCDDPRVVVECKSHRWTVGSNVPSGKLRAWNEAMYYFHLLPSGDAGYRKIMFVLSDCREDGKSLAEYYLDKYRHLVPDSVEFWEFDEGARNAKRIL